jgi:hypothetical protein
VEEEPDPTRFVPYESPLRQFKSYRYHPNYAQDVPSGFLSMTYSHQIDPDLPVCPTEAEGHACTDLNCPYQHFQGMNITGAFMGHPTDSICSLSVCTQTD